MAGREPTGIPGFDDLVEGGIPKGSITLVSGSPGTGKSIFSQQFLYTGATKFDQKVLYITLEQRISDVWEQCKRFGWDFEALSKKGLAKFIFMDITQRTLKQGETYVDTIFDEAMKFKPERLVIDSLVPLANFPMSVDELAHYGLLGELDKLMPIGINQDVITRMQVHKLLMALRDTGATSIVISEVAKNSEWFSRDQVSEFLSDAVVVLHYLGIGSTSNRSLTIEKMRGTKHSEDVMPMEITKKGIVIKKAEDAYKV